MQERLNTHFPRFNWHRPLAKLAIDGLIGTAAWELTRLIRPETPSQAWAAGLWLLASAATSGFSQIFRQHYRFTGFRDFIRIACATLALLAVEALVYLLGLHYELPFRTWIIATLLTGLGWVLVRAVFRIFEENLLDRHKIFGQRTLIYGAGRAGVMVAEELERHRELGYHLVGFLDDDLSKQGVRLRGYPVLGPQEMLATLTAQFDIETLILAIPSASGSDIRRISESAQKCGLQVKTVPGIFNLLGSKNWRPELRDVSIEDLLRRESIQLDQQSLRTVVADRVVLVTGAGGSIGSELARQLCNLLPSRIVLLGRGENSLWETERSLRKLFPNQPIAIELCDIRNRRRLRQAFSHWKPEIVFHAAAHKHVPFLELHPEEAVENNILGTKNVLEAAIDGKVWFFVNISTDKAVNPTNVLGASKRVAEMLVAEASTHVPEGSRYVSVRFGNVLGSRGSVVPIFRDQIQTGGPITVTHPEMTRYFMTIPEASQLVIQAGLLGETGKVYVLDMGQPVRITDLASDMIKLSGLVPDQDIEITYSGIRPGEKLFEELFYGEAERSKVHPKVFEAVLGSQEPGSLSLALVKLEDALAQDERSRAKNLVLQLKELVPGYAPSELGAGRWIAESTQSGKVPAITV